MNPKYNTIEVCEYLSLLKNCKVVLGSATPSVVSFYKALKGNYELIELKKRELIMENFLMYLLWI